MSTFVGYCKVCGKEFIKYREYHKICSDKCRQIQTERDSYGYVRKDMTTKKCDECGKEFITNRSNRHFCCDQCAMDYNRRVRIKKEKQTRICKVCGKEFQTSHHAKKYCTKECYQLEKKRRESHV